MLLFIRTIIGLMPLLSLKKLKSPSLAPISSTAFIRNSSSIIVHSLEFQICQTLPPVIKTCIINQFCIYWQSFQSFCGCHNIIFLPSQLCFRETSKCNLCFKITFALLKRFNFISFKLSIKKFFHRGLLPWKLTGF